MYKPLIGIDILEERKATIIGRNQALRVAALYDCFDRDRKRRVAGEQWLINTVGAYMLQECERSLGLIDAVVLTPTVALDVCANESFTDSRGKPHRTGDRYVISIADTDAFIPDVKETIVQQLRLVTLNKQQFCVVENAYDESGKPAFGRSELRRGPTAFFLRPHEYLRGGVVHDVIVLGAEEAIVGQCIFATKTALFSFRSQYNICLLVQFALCCLCAMEIVNDCLANDGKVMSFDFRLPNSCIHPLDRSFRLSNSLWAV